MAWYSAPSVRAALAEADRLWPNRKRDSDGTIGNTAHSIRESDHNPDSRGMVHAFDLTHDPDHGVDCTALAAAIVERRDPRLRYLIWKRWITYGPWAGSVARGERRPWTSEPYRGPNPHDKHMHVSIGYTAGAESDTGPWWTVRPVPVQEDPIPMALPLLNREKTGEDVQTLQALLTARGVPVKIDGDFGPSTERAVHEFQRRAKLRSDGVVGPQTWRALLRLK